MKYFALIAVGLAACVDSSVTVCGNGFVCRQGAVCAQVTVLDSVTTLCVEPEQEQACEGLPDGAACTYGMEPSTCHGGACLADDCGNGLQDSTEVCDDGNSLSTDGCSADCTSTLVCGNGIVDVVRGEQCDGGADHLGHDGCTSGCGGETLQWKPLIEDRPETRLGAGAAYDAHAGEIVLFGGRSSVPPPEYYVFHNDTFAWDGIRWRRRATPVAPSPRDFAALTYDEARDAIVMYGKTGDTWTLRGGSWQLENPATRPGNSGADLIYERARQRVILFGYDGTWAWDGANWSELPQTDAMLKYRTGAALAYDDARNVVVMVGGTLNLTDPLDDVWELVGDVWQKRMPSGAPPPARRGARMAFSPADGELLLVGGNGRVSNVDVPYRDAWRYNGTRWEQEADAPFPAIDLNTGIAQYISHAIATDPVRRTVVVFGNNGKVHEWNGTAWRTPSGGVWTDRPVSRTPRFNAAGAVDPRHGLFVTYGGQYPNGGGFGEIDETWIYDGRWLSVTPTVTPARFGSSLVYDPVHDEFVLFGGCTSAGSQFQDTYLLRRDASNVWSWTSVSPATKPPGRCHAAMYFDDTTGKVVLWSGMDGQYSPIDDMWTWNGTTWTPSTPPATRPLPRYLAASGYDPIAHALVVTGGGGIDMGVSANFDDTWAWNGSTWTEIVAPGPGYRANARMAWDAARKRLVLVGGTDSLASAEDVWELDLSTQTWRPLAVSGLARQAHVLVSAYDNRDGVFLYGGFTGDSANASSAIRDDLWHLTWDTDTQYETCRLQDSDGDQLVGCDDPDCWSVCTPGCPPGASCSGVPVLCGDGTCDADLEQCTTCPDDCGSCM